MRRKSPTKAEQIWRERIDAANAFNGTAAAYCRERDIDLNSFYSWRKRMKSRGVVASTSPFAAAVIDVTPSLAMKSFDSLPEARWVAEVMAHFLRAVK